MPAERLPMRQVREVLRLKYLCGQSGHRIAAAIGISRYTVAEYLRRAAVVGITWPVPPDLDDTVLERKLFTLPGAMVAEALRPQPDWVRIHAEMRRAGVTLLLLWEEYRAGQPEGYGYSRFCDLYAAWRGRLSPTMRQSHPLGERLFVDYAGQTVEVIDAITGEVRTAQIFVAALGASNLTYAEARWTQGLADWIGCHVNAFVFLGGVTRQVVCDNLKAGVTAACRYEPGINHSYADMATHYGTAVVPTRVRKPRDKAKVEVAVQLVQRWVLARLRHQRFFSLAELNRAIDGLIEALITEQTVELFHRGTRVASHIRSPLRGRHTTVAEHMPSSHRRYADWTPARLMREAAVIGPSTTALVELILHAKPHPEQGFRACLGILRLVRAWGGERVEAACQRGIDIGARSYSSIVSILRNNLDRAYRPQSVPDEPPVQHSNIRGGRYYH
jgi:transposase